MNHFLRCKATTVFGLSAALLCVSLGAMPKAATAGTPAPVSSSAAAGLVGSDERLAHPRVSGPLGPWRAVEVWLTQSSEIDDGPFTARVVVAAHGAKPDVYTLPPPDETDSAFMMKVRAVMFRRVDDKPERAMIVLYTAAQIGPGHAPYDSTCVYAWDGGAFVRNLEVEDHLRGARTSADVNRRLAARRAR